jgi:hypothetical protein
MSVNEDRVQKPDRYLLCKCGKKKMIHWVDKWRFLKGHSSFIVGVSQCSCCNVIQEHYSGNMIDIQEFIDLKGSQYEGSPEFKYNHEGTRH